MFKASYSIDYLDPNPETEIFDTFEEAMDWLVELVWPRVMHVVEHSQYSLSEEEVEEIEEQEWALTSIRPWCGKADC